MKLTKPKRKGRAAGNSATLERKLRRAICGVLQTLQRPFLAVFWWLEKRLARLQDQLGSDA